MKLKCLFLDHDDTVFDSTQSIHYPAFCRTLETLRSNLPIITYQDFTHHCHHLGFQDLCVNRYGFSDEEMKVEYQIWKSFTQTKMPLPYPGWLRIFEYFRKLGGHIVVISHSESQEIRRDYLHHFGFEPDLIYGWDMGEAYRKPEIYPLLDGLKQLSLKPEECLMVDDMSLGQKMAQKGQVPFAWAAWSYDEDQLNAHQKSPSERLFKNLDELYDYIVEATT